MKMQIYFVTVIVSLSIGTISTQKCGRPAIAPYETNIFDKVVGGREARRNSWPWQARFGATSTLFGVTASRQYCGATIINARWLTLLGSDAYDSFVRVGLHNQDVDESQEPKSRKYYLKRIISHPDYQNRTDVDNDIALLELIYPIQFTNEISPICLPLVGSDPAAGRECIATGWGVTQQRLESFPPAPRPSIPPNPDAGMPTNIPPPSDVLKQVVVNVVDRDVCNSSLHYNGSVYETNVCAFRHGQGVCQSDSGGPLVCKNKAGAFELVGVTSWGIGCADDNYPAVYAHVGFYMPWIKASIGL